LFCYLWSNKYRTKRKSLSLVEINKTWHLHHHHLVRIKCGFTAVRQLDVSHGDSPPRIAGNKDLEFIEIRSLVGRRFASSPPRESTRLLVTSGSFMSIQKPPFRLEFRLGRNIASYCAHKLETWKNFYKDSSIFLEKDLFWNRNEEYNQNLTNCQKCLLHYTKIIKYFKFSLFRINCIKLNCIIKARDSLWRIKLKLLYTIKVW